MNISPKQNPEGYRVCHICERVIEITTLYDGLSFCRTCMRRNSHVVLLYIAAAAGISRSGVVFKRLQLTDIERLNPVLIRRAKQGLYRPEGKHSQWAVNVDKA